MKFLGETWWKWLGALLLLAPLTCYAEEPLPKDLVGVEVQEKLGTTITLDRQFTDTNGKRVKLADYFGSDKPVLLTLNYSRCAMLCSLQLNGLIEGLSTTGLTPGKDFNLVTVSIDPKETFKMAEQRNQAMLKKLNLEGATWDFLVGAPGDVKALADEIGFKYNYIPEDGQYAHTLAVYFLSPKGKLARYLYGLEYKSRDVKFAIMDAGEGKVGSTVDKILLSCYHYDETKGKYGPTAMKVMRVSGIGIVLIVGTGLARFWRRERNLKKA